MTPEILILCATKKEIAPLLAQSSILSRTRTKSNVPVITCQINNKVYTLLITGPGVMNTAHALTSFLENNPVDFPVDLIIQTGIAGVFETSGLGIGDIGIATREIYIHTGVKNETIKNDPLPFDLIKNDSKTRKGEYLFDDKDRTKCFNLLSHHVDGKGITIGKGPFITVSAITSGRKAALELYTTFSPLMEAMEGAASSHVAKLYGIPFVEIRSASNFVGERKKENWNLALSSQMVSKSCATIITHWS
jgi:futalosine hydrolase